MSITTSIVPPKITQHFNKYLLMDTFTRIMFDFENVVIPLARKKIRPQDVGKKKQFELLKERFVEIYERKKTEKEKYDRKIAEAKKKVSFTTNAGPVRIFRKMEAER